MLHLNPKWMKMIEEKIKNKEEIDQIVNNIPAAQFLIRSLKDRPYKLYNMGQS